MSDQSAIPTSHRLRNGLIGRVDILIAHGTPEQLATFVDDSVRRVYDVTAPLRMAVKYVDATRRLLQGLAGDTTADSATMTRVDRMLVSAQHAMPPVGDTTRALLFLGPYAERAAWARNAVNLREQALATQGAQTGHRQLSIQYGAYRKNGAVPADRALRAAMADVARTELRLAGSRQQTPGRQGAPGVPAAVRGSAAAGPTDARRRGSAA